jgi:hypothetical protein
VAVLALVPDRRVDHHVPCTVLDPRNSADWIPGVLPLVLSPGTETRYLLRGIAYRASNSKIVAFASPPPSHIV